MALLSSFPVVGALSFYPIKSCKGIDLQHAYVGKRGLQVSKILDRSWMLVDAKGVMITQRDKPYMATIAVDLMFDDHGIAERLRVSAKGHQGLVLSIQDVSDVQILVVIHGKETVAHCVAPKINQWFSHVLGAPIQLVHQTEDDIRYCDPLFAAEPGADIVGFADGFPYLITTTGTLEELNQRLDAPVGMKRFRPNIVISNVQGDAEYTWRNLRVGEVQLTLVKPCTRCVMTTIDQETGVRTGNQPVSGLTKTHFLSQSFGEARIQGVIFGENAVVSTEGFIAVGDVVSVMATKPAPLFKRKVVSRIAPI